MTFTFSDQTSAETFAAKLMERVDAPSSPFRGNGEALGRGAFPDAARFLAFAATCNGSARLRGAS